MTTSKAAVLLLWIILVFTHLGFHFAVREESSSSRTRQVHHSLWSAPPRKVWVFDTTNSFQAPSSSPVFSGNEDDKRIFLSLKSSALLPSAKTVANFLPWDESFKQCYCNKYI
ncbi:hypothetical protein GQ457_15G003930 [Hibiscus cannabinus]